MSKEFEQRINKILDVLCYETRTFRELMLYMLLRHVDMDNETITIEIGENMNQLDTTIREFDGMFYIPLDDNLKLLREQNELLKENHELKKQLADKPVWVTGLEWLKEQVGIKSDEKIKGLILNAETKKVLAVENGGPVKWSKGKGSDWRFEPVRMKKYLEEHFSDILVKEGKK